MHFVNFSFMLTTLLVLQSNGQDVQDCYDDSDNGESYRGVGSTTVSGFKCQNWTMQSPHVHSRTPENYPFAGLERNYCRNPDLDDRPWCYTTERTKRWEYCDIPICSGKTTAQPVTPSPTVVIETSSITSSVTMEITEGSSTTPAVDPSDCYKVQDDGASYRGVISMSESGYPCQKWIEQSPHQHSRTPANFPTAGLDNNYCRNPDNEERPWCYTTNPKRRWQYCNVRLCPDTSSTTTISSTSSMASESSTSSTIGAPPSNTTETSTSSMTEKSTLSTTEKSTLSRAETSISKMTEKSTLSTTEKSTLSTTETSTSSVTEKSTSSTTGKSKSTTPQRLSPDVEASRPAMGPASNTTEFQPVTLETKTVAEVEPTEQTSTIASTTTEKNRPCESNPCHENATCLEKGDSAYSCQCNIGLRGDGIELCRLPVPCEDTRCHAKALCLPIGDEFRCQCRPGYEGNGIFCRIVNHCRTAPCHRDAICQHAADGGLICICRAGYQGDGKRCRKISPCETNPCHGNATCLDNGKSFSCKCMDGMTGDGVRVCRQIDPCNGISCQSNAKCIRDDRSQDGYRCECNYGKMYHNDGSRSCVGWLGKHICDGCNENAKCFLHNESFASVLYECRCNAGYVGDGKECKKILPCDSVKCPRNTNCVNEDEMHFHCQCSSQYTGTGPSCSVSSKTTCAPSGWWRFKTPRYCKWDPCYNYQCPELATCENTWIGTSCVCKSGYTLCRRGCVNNRHITLQCFFNLM